MRLILAVVAGVILSFGTAMAECPDSQGATTPQIPDGATATRGQMIAAQRAVKAYDTAIRQYAQCLQDAGDSTPKRVQAVAKDEQLADEFNTQLHVYEAKHKGD
ncbi:MAG: hypothetical protein ACRETK_01495 [Steroidobacteraceae bacterium]